MERVKGALEISTRVPELKVNVPSLAIVRVSPFDSKFVKIALEGRVVLLDTRMALVNEREPLIMAIVPDAP
jgi:hypothetical protein